MRLSKSMGLGHRNRNYAAPSALVATALFTLGQFATTDAADQQIADKLPNRPAGAARVVSWAQEIDWMKRRLGTLRQEEAQAKARGAGEKELAAIRDHIAKSERQLKEWEARKSALVDHAKPKDAAPARMGGEVAERISQLRAAADNLHAADMHELAAQVMQKVQELEHAQPPKAAPKLDGDGDHDGGNYTSPSRYTAGYTSDAPKAPAVWVKPLDTGVPALALFEKRILPIFNSLKASSCTECHLSGVELKDYIFPSQEKTFASLLKAKLVNVQNPDQSKILEFISRRPDKPGLVSDEMRQQEFEAFRAWLHVAVKDPHLLAARSDTPDRPSLPPEVIRHARTDRVLASFIENVWSEMHRCSSCHSPETNQKQVERHGEMMSWITPNDPLATIRYLASEGLIDVNKPAESPLLTKPTLEESHKGGQKMLKGDRSYRQFRAFIEDYAAMAKGRYTSTDQLPKAPALVPTPVPVILRVTDVPEQFAKKPMQVDVYSWTDAGWSRDPVASATWPVIPKNRIWQFRLTLLTPRDSATKEMPKLAPGRYLARIYIDDKGRLEKEPLVDLGASEFRGQVEFQSEWKPTPQNATVIRYPAETASR